MCATPRPPSRWLPIASFSISLPNCTHSSFFAFLTTLLASDFASLYLCLPSSVTAFNISLYSIFFLPVPHHPPSRSLLHPIPPLINATCPSCRTHNDFLHYLPHLFHRPFLESMFHLPTPSGHVGLMHSPDLGIPELLPLMHSFLTLLMHSCLPAILNWIFIKTR